MIRVAFLLEGNPRNWMGGLNYLRNLLWAAQSYPDREIQPVLFCGEKFPSDILNEFPELQIVRSTWFDRLSVAWVARRLLQRAHLSNPFLAALFRKHGVNVLSHSSEGDRLTAGLLQLGWIPDFQHMHLPQFFPGKQLAAREVMLRRVCDTSHRLIVSSYCAKRDLSEFYPDKQLQADVLQFAVMPPDKNQVLPLQELIERYDLRTKYIYVPNQFWAHKNHMLLVEALAILRKKGVEIQCVLTGSTEDSRNPGYFSQLMTAVANRGVGKEFHVLGVVGYREVQSLMFHAHAVLNPSLFEGWSTTVEEAKALGKRLLLSDIPVHREQAEEIARFFDKTSPAALASLLEGCVSELGVSVDDAAYHKAGRALQEYAKAYQDIVISLFQSAGQR